MALRSQVPCAPFWCHRCAASPSRGRQSRPLGACCQFYHMMTGMMTEVRYPRSSEHFCTLDRGGLIQICPPQRERAGRSKSNGRCPRWSIVTFDRGVGSSPRSTDIVGASRYVGLVPRHEVVAVLALRGSKSREAGSQVRGQRWRWQGQHDQLMYCRRATHDQNSKDHLAGRH
jgi:hypothetical protein